MDAAPYTWAHVLTQMQLLLFAGLAFFVMLPFLKRALSITLDTDWLWRRAGPAAVGALGTVVRIAQHAYGEAWSGGIAAVVNVAQRINGPDSRFASTWRTSSMAISVLVLLLGYLLLYYL